MAAGKSTRIAADLRSKIARGELRPGERLPSEAGLRETHGASRTTVRKALLQLANEGLLVSVSGSGWYVREHVTLTYHASRAERVNGRSEADAYVCEVAAQGRVPSQDFSMQVLPAPNIATRLGVKEGELVVCRRCIRYVDGQPWSDQYSYYPMDVAQEAGLLTPEDIPEGTIRAMARSGHVEVRHVDEITGRMPTPDEAQTMDIGTGIPLIVIVRTASTRDRPVRVTQTLFPADRNRITYEMEDVAHPGGEPT